MLTSLLRAERIGAAVIPRLWALPLLLEHVLHGGRHIVDSRSLHIAFHTLIFKQIACGIALYPHCTTVLYLVYALKFKAGIAKDDRLKARVSSLLFQLMFESRRKWASVRT